MPLVEQELLPFRRTWVHPRFLVGFVLLDLLCVCFVDRCLSFCTFSFGHCVVCSSSIYRVRILITPLASSNIIRSTLNIDYCYSLFSVIILSFPEKYVDQFMKIVHDKGLTTSGRYIFIHLTFGAGLNHTSTQPSIFSSLLEVGPVSTRYSSFIDDCKNVTQSFVVPSIHLSYQVST